MAKCPKKELILELVLRSVYIEQLDSGFEKVTAKTYANIVAKVRKIEDEFWADDLKLDAQESG